MVEQSYIGGEKLGSQKREKFRGISINISTATSNVVTRLYHYYYYYLCTFNIYIYISAVVEHFDV